MINYGRQNIDQTDIDAAIETLQSAYLTQGPKVPEFELKVSTYCKADHAVATNSATSALHCACLSLGLGEGDILWTSPITFVASANCGIYCGATIDFVDIDPATYNICIDQLEAKLIEAEKNNALPKVVVVVHLCGQSCDMKSIYDLSLRYGFKVIEDASHAIGASYDGKRVGSCLYSDITIFSFHPVKIITSAEGGMALTNDIQLAERMRLIRSHGVTRNPSLMQEQNPDPWLYEQICIGFNYRMSDLHAALGCSQMERIDRFIQERNDIALRYSEKLQNLKIQLPVISQKNQSSFHLYVIRVPAESRLKLYNHLKTNGVLCNVHYIPVHLQPYYRQLGFNTGDFPSAEAYYSEALTLPIYPGLTASEQEKIITLIKESLS